MLKSHSIVACLIVLVGVTLLSRKHESYIRVMFNTYYHDSLEPSLEDDFVLI